MTSVWALSAPPLLAGAAVLAWTSGPSAGRRLDAALALSRPATATPAVTSTTGSGSSPPLSASRLAFRPSTGSGFARTLLLASVVLAALVWIAGPGVLVGCVGAVAVWSLVARRGRLASIDVERRGAAEACGVLASELRAGQEPALALGEAARTAEGPFAAALAGAATAARLGADVSEALLWSAGPGPSPQRGRPGTAARRRGRRQAGSTAVPEVLRALAACWAVCTSAGSGLAAAVERLEEGLRADEAQRRAVAAELAGPRATAMLLAGLPLIGIVLAAALGADPLGVLFNSTVGRVCLVSGLALDVAGVAWTARLVRRAGGT